MRSRRQGRTRGQIVAAALVLSVVSLPHCSAQATGTETEAQSSKSADAHLERARSYAKQGNFAASIIELRNAAQQAPQDAHIHALLAEAYLKASNFPSAETEGRTARRLNGREAEYLLPLAEAMLRQGKFGEVAAQIKPGDRPPAMESKIRQALADAALGLHDTAHAEGLLHQAIALDENDPEPKTALAQLLLKSDVGEAEKIVDAVLAADPHQAKAITIKGEILAGRHDPEGAMKRFAEALEVDPSNVTARLARASLNLTRSAFPEVDKDLDHVLTVAPRNEGANYLRAKEDFQKRDFAAADKILDQISGRMFSYAPEGLYLQAATKYALGQYGQADDAIAKYVARVPSNPFGVRLAATIALRRKAPDIAVKYLTDYLTKYSPDAETLTLLGNAYSAMNKPTLALEQFEKATALQPENLSLKTLVAASQFNAGATSEGLEALEKVFTTDAGMTVAGPTLVLTDLRAGKTDEAAETAQKLVNQHPNNLLYQNLLGMARVAQKDFAGAEAVFKDIVAKDPDFAPARINLAHAYMAASQIDQAKKAYEDLLSRKPDNIAALLGLADIAIKEKQWDAAIDDANKAGTAAPTDPAPGLKLLEIYALRQNWSRAKALASDLTTRFPGNAAVFTGQGQILAASGDQDGATEAYRRAYALAPDSAPTFTRYLSMLAEAKRFPEIRTILQSRVDKNPADQQAKEQLIRVEAEISGLEAALAKARAYAKADPVSSVYDLVSADLLERAGKSAEAVPLLEKSAAAHPRDVQVVLALAKLYLHSNNLPKAEALLVARLNEHPGDIILRTSLADIYIKETKFDAAIAEERRVLGQEQNNAVALNNLAWLYQQTGDLPKAREFAEKAAAVAPANGSVEDTLGWVLLAQGDTEKAVSHLEAASAATPGNPDIGYHLAVALGRAGRPGDARVILEKLLNSGVSFSSKPEAEKLLNQLKSG